MSTNTDLLRLAAVVMQKGGGWKLITVLAIQHNLHGRDRVWSLNVHTSWWLARMRLQKCNSLLSIQRLIFFQNSCLWDRLSLLTDHISE
jgi:hypothetical protein